MGQGGRLCVRVHAAQAGRPRLGTVGIAPGGVRGLDMGTAMLGLRVRTRRVAKLGAVARLAIPYTPACCTLAAQRQQSLASQGIRKWVPVWVALEKPALRPWDRSNVSWEHKAQVKGRA